MADEIKKPNEPLDPRVYFASERTLLAWIRTGLAMMGFGFVVARFGLFLREMATMRDVPPQSHSGLSLSVGTTLVILGVVVNILASVFVSMVRVASPAKKATLLVAQRPFTAFEGGIP